ncbi:hypothetical protein [Microbacterium sp. BK668]|uniref:hypothetical protein n=1 Tax=Microbacterium sp. BK668 TaxID=2512118 RepID=UPI001060A94C|nr:hypothetical protein [Microbacterium sp. BK668]TDN91294.1 hypothetical protein EV279_0793 [Microbacterium sp. BK668]
MSIPVSAAPARYRGAVGELPVTALTSDSAAGSVVVVDGAGRWWDDAALAISAGAAAIVVSRPAPAPAAGVARLAGAPVVLERPLLRPDTASDVEAAQAAAPSASALVVECHASAAELGAALRDALGWVRQLAPGAPALLSTAFADGRGTALIDAGGGVTVSLVAGASAGAPPCGRIRATTLGETRLEVELEEGDIRLTTTDAAFRRVWPTRFESAERIALRRAAEAVRSGAMPSDLADYARDSALAEAIWRRASDAGAEASTS